MEEKISLLSTFEKISSKTPKIASRLSKNEIQKRCKKKRRSPLEKVR